MVDLPAPETPWTATIRSAEVSAIVAAAIWPALSSLSPDAALIRSMTVSAETITRPPLAALDLCKDAALRRERLGRRDMGDDAVDPVILARDQLLVADELGDARVDMRGGDTLQPEVERGHGDVRHRERGFALGMDADRGGDGVLGAQIHRRDAQPVEAAGDERIGGSE